MSLVRQFYASTVGKKVAMALSGLILVGFVIGHMAGNLKIFGGVNPATGNYYIDEYGHHLRVMGSELFGYSGFLWIVRVVLIAALFLHVVSGIQLARLNRKAKPEGYEKRSYRSANAASLTMIYGGLFLLCFVVFHILHFTTGQAHFAGFVEGKVYANVWSGFQSLPIVGVYVVAMAFLALHLYHGVWSMFQTLGVDTPRWNRTIRSAAKAVAVALFVGFSSVPVAIGAGVMPAPVQTPGPAGH
jgi:succinate dehydrogenase / fumarate reductase cytochrome b subunit